MIRRTLVALLCLGVTAFSVRIGRAQQAAPAPHPDDRPIRVVKISSPFAQYRYRLGSGKQDQYFAGFSQMVLSPVEAGEPPKPVAEKMPGRNSKYEAITLERGLTHDSDFSKWAGVTRENQSPRDLVLDSFNEAGHKNGTRQLIGCIVAEYHAVANLDGGANSFSIEHLQLHCKGVK
jgi:phage tail-like protein